MAISPNAISTLTGSTKTVSNKQRKELEVSVMSINKAIVVGNLGRDPEVRALPSGQNVANFSVATKARFKDRNGEQQERTEWHRVVAFGKLADNCQRLLSKGRQVYVEGRLTTRQYEAKDGSGPRYRTEIVALQLRVLGNRLNSNAPNTETSDDIPF
jgi:single-strand DNA-binding protein